MKNELKRELKTPGAILMGLGSIVGTGIFVSIAIATQIAGNGIIISVVIAAVLAAFNGLSSAQLAAAHPVSGGTYEYGNRFLNSYFGFAAGWLFLIAKSASAATAVLGCIGYFFHAVGVNTGSFGIISAGLLLLFLMTFLVSGGIRRSNQANNIIVTVTLLGLVALLIISFVVKGFPVQPIINSVKDTSVTSILYGSALMFVAYTGYGRIATLGEEVSEPRTTIPKAIILTMVIIVLLYLTVSLTALQVMGAEAFGQSVEGKAAPLMRVAQALSFPLIGPIITIAAITAMLGVLLNLLLGLSRVILSMARRKDLPPELSKINEKTKSPSRAVWVAGGIIGILILSGDIVFTWSFSAFTVLIYYAITNLSALRMPAELRLYPQWVPASGLIGCLLLAFWIESTFWIGGLALLGVGLIWHLIAVKLKYGKED